MIAAPKHKTEKDLPLTNFYRGMNEEVPAEFLGMDELVECYNLKYITTVSKDNDNNTNYDTVLEKRQGTQEITNSAITDGAAIRACTYYFYGGIYIVATSTKLFYLDGSYDPVEIGTNELSGVPTFTEFHNKLFIHDGGILKAISGSTPTSVETLTCIYEDEVLGTGDGSTTHFTYTLINTDVEESSVTIEWYNAAGTMGTITDDGDGNLEGDVNESESSTINYSTGAISLYLAAAAANDSVITVTYKKANGAPKSTSGLVRASRLYLFGDTDNTSRMWYSGVNDEYGWDSSSGGGYVDIDPDDGQTLQGGVNDDTSLVLIKSSSLKRIDSYPGDAVFRVDPVSDKLGCSDYYKTICAAEGMITFTGPSGWMSASLSSDTVTTGLELSKKFHSTVMSYLDSDNMIEFFETDHQFWLGMYDTSTPLSYIYVLSVPYGQLSLYRFRFNWSCFKYINGEMLIGSTAGKLYRMNSDTQSYQDDGVEYSNYTYATTGKTELGLPFNNKLIKNYRVEVYGNPAPTGFVEFYVNGATNISHHSAFPPVDYNKKFDLKYKTIQVKFRQLEGSGGVKLKGVIMKTAVLGQ